MNEDRDVRELPVKHIELNTGVQPRHRLDKTTIKEYAEDMRNGALFPPIVVFHEEGSERYICASGFHRVNAAGEAEKETILCDVRTGSVRDATLFAVSANAEHGLRRNNKDKRKAVTMLLQDPEWQTRSAEWIADACRVSRPFVSSVRSDLITAGEIDEPETVTTADGKERRPNRASVTGTSDRNRYDTPDSGGKSDTSKNDVEEKPAKKAKPKPTKEQAEAAKQVRESHKRKTQDQINRDEFFEGLQSIRAACVYSGREAANRWECDDRRDELEYVRDFLTDILEVIDARAGTVKDAEQ